MEDETPQPALEVGAADEVSDAEEVEEDESDTDESDSNDDSEIPSYVRMICADPSKDLTRLLSLPLSGQGLAANSVPFFHESTESPPGNGWEQRSLRLRENFLFVYTSMHDSRPLAVFHLLTGLATVAVVSFGGRSNCVEVEQELGGIAGKLYLHLSSPVLAEQWCTALREAAELTIESLFSLHKRVGKGAFSEVRVAMHKTTKESYAVKIIDKVSCDMFSDQLSNEIHTLSMVDHPNVLCIKLVFETQTMLYILTELLTGGELFDHIAALASEDGTGYSERHAATLMGMIFSALTHLHDKGIMHRDLKPENLLFTHAEGVSELDAQLKLVDFGISKTMDISGELTKTMTGTPFYVAPEIVRLTSGSGNGYGHMVDLWAAGVINYILICGFPPFRSDTNDVGEILDKVEQGEYDFPSPYWDDVSPEAKDLVSALLTLDPNKRITAKEALHHRWMRTADRSRVMGHARAEMASTCRGY